MKYRDLMALFITLGLVLSFAYTIGVDSSIWFIPIILFLLLVIFIYELWIKK